MELGNGPGKYDDICTYVREQTKAEGAVVLVFDGDKGSGFAVQVDGTTLVKLPIILEVIAQEIREDLEKKLGELPC